MKKIIKCLKQIGLKKKDNIFIHCDVSLLKKFESAEDMELTCKNLLNAILEVIGPRGTLAIPTYTYSFCKKKIYDVENSKSECGYFSEYCRKLNVSKKYVDPNLSVAIIGEKAFFLAKNPTINSYGKGSFFEKFTKLNGKILNINMDSGTTFVHYFERLLKVDYRKDKKYKGIMISKKKKIKLESIIYLRKDKKLFHANFENLHKVAVKKKYFITNKYGYGHFGLISLTNIKKIVFEYYKKQKNFLIYDSLS